MTNTNIERLREWRDRQSRALAVTTPTLPSVIAAPAPALAEPAPAIKSSAPTRIGRSVIGTTLIGSAAVLAVTSMRANAWFGYALSVDDAAGQIFSHLSVTAELIAFVLPTANRLYRQLGERWTAAKGSLMAILAASVVAFAASGFVLTNVSDKAAKRSQAAPAVEVAHRALADARTARDRECVKVGPICRQREDAVVMRSQELIGGMAHAVGDPQAKAFGIDPATLRLAQAGALVGMCLLAGLVLSHGWGLVFRV